MTTLTKRAFLAGTAAAGAMVAAPAVLRAQATVLRWGEVLPATHPQVQMIDRIAAEVKEKTGGRIEIQGFPNGQLGSGDMIEAVASGALQMTTEGAAEFGACVPALSVVEAPYIWRDAAHMAKVAATPIVAEINDDLVKTRGMRMLGVDLLRQAPHHDRQQGSEERRRHGRLQAARAGGRHVQGDGRGVGRASRRR